MYHILFPADKKLLDKRAALPPKYSYDVVKNQTKGKHNDFHPVKHAN